MKVLFVTHETKRKLQQVWLVVSQYQESCGIESVMPVKANLLNVLSITSHHLTPTKQTRPSGFWHYCKPTAPPKHAFSYLSVPYKVCNSTTTLNIYISMTSRRNTQPFASNWARMSLAACLCLVSVAVVPLRVYKAILHLYKLSRGKKRGRFGSGSELSEKVRTAESNL